MRTIVSDVRSKSFERSSIFRNNRSHKLDTSFQFDSNIKTCLTNFESWKSNREEKEMQAKIHENSAGNHASEKLKKKRKSE